MLAERRASEESAAKELPSGARRSASQVDAVGALGEMAAGVAHNLNQCLGLVLGHTEMAEMALREPQVNRDEILQSLAIVAQAARDGADTLRRIQSFVRSSDDAEEPIDLADLIGDVARLTAPKWRDLTRAEGRPVSLFRKVFGDVTVVGHAPSLRQALTNLIFNAVDAMPAGGTLRLSVTRIDACVEIEVADTGVGMSSEARERAFDPFFSTKGERGTGLGLSAVRTVVEQHRGRIGVRSAPGSGTTVVISLPAISSSVTRTVRADPGEPRSVTSNGVRRRVLIVDDDPRMMEMVARMLEPRHDVIGARSAEEALERLDRGAIDVLLTDLGLGDGPNGWELAAIVRQRWPGTRIVLTTGWGPSLDLAEARRRGVSEILAKPYSLRALTRVVTAD